MQTKEIEMRLIYDHDTVGSVCYALGCSEPHILVILNMILKTELVEGDLLFPFLGTEDQKLHDRANAACEDFTVFLQKHLDFFIDSFGAVYTEAKKKQAEAKGGV